MVYCIASTSRDQLGNQTYWMEAVATNQQAKVERYHLISLDTGANNLRIQNFSNYYFDWSHGPTNPGNSANG